MGHTARSEFRAQIDLGTTVSYRGHVQYLDYCTRCNNYQRLRLRVKKTTLNLNH